MADEPVPEAAETLPDLSSVSSSSSSSSSSSDPTRLSRDGSFSRLNAGAPEFVPRAASAPPPLPDPRLAIPPPGLVRVLSPPPNSTFHAQMHYQPQHFGDAAEPHRRRSDEDYQAPSKNGRSDEAAHQKIVNQVEYYFSDVNLATTDQLIRFINKDPEGYVPISVVASFKKIKSFTNDHSQLAAILRKSKKLVVSEDGKKVRRKHLLTESDMEDLQSRIVVAENLPDDHCYQTLMKIFSVVGRVKAIRTCQPQTSNGLVSSTSRSTKTDNVLFSKKLHAFVEYDTVELAEKAVAELNGEGTWRSSLRVWLMGRHVPNQARGRKGHESDGDASTLEQQPIEMQSEDTTRQSEFHSHEHPGEEYATNREGGQYKGRNRGRGKGRGRAQSHHYPNNNHRATTVGTPPANVVLANILQSTVAKQHPPGPRMPDGTRGFAMGRGKPVAVNNV